MSHCKHIKNGRKTFITILFRVRKTHIDKYIYINERQSYMRIRCIIAYRFFIDNANEENRYTIYKNYFT